MSNNYQNPQVCDVNGVPHPIDLATETDLPIPPTLPVYVDAVTRAVDAVQPDTKTIDSSGAK